MQQGHLIEQEQLKFTEFQLYVKNSMPLLKGRCKHCGVHAFKRLENAWKINHSDGRAVFTVKQPAKNIPHSYTVWEQQVDAAGKNIRLNKTTVGPDGELIHIKPYSK